MSEQSPYEKLGVKENASFEEIQEAKQRLNQQYREDKNVLESIDAAYDAIIMDRLKLRQEGKIKVPERIRFPEKLEQTTPNSTPIKLNNSASWLQSLLDTPSRNDILWPAGIFLTLGSLTIFAEQEIQTLSLLMALGFSANIYFINRKEKRFGRSLLISLICLLLGVGLGTLTATLLATNGINLIAKEQFACLLTFFLFWLTSSFLR